MAEYRFTTKRGSEYLLDTDRMLWRKNFDSYDTIWEYAAVPVWEDDRREVLQVGLVEWSRTHGDMFRLPELGECLYILGRETWWLSTEVIQIEELE